MTDGVSQIGAIECVKVEILDAAGVQHPALFGGDAGGNQFSGFRVIIQALEQVCQPVRYIGAAQGGEFFLPGQNS